MFPFFKLQQLHRMVPSHHLQTLEARSHDPHAALDRTITFMEEGWEMPGHVGPVSRSSTLDSGKILAEDLPRRSMRGQDDHGADCLRVLFNERVLPQESRFMQSATEREALHE